MIAVSTPAEMAAIDAASSVPVTELIERAGSAVARSAIDMLGGTYGRRVTAVCGPGNNGGDGLVAAERLRRLGVKVEVVAPDVGSLPPADLVIDAAFGTGLTRPYEAPDAGGMPVLAVDIASGVDGLTGQLLGKPMLAERTVTFQAAKPGHLLGPGRGYTGKLSVADIGLDGSTLTARWISDRGVAKVIPTRTDDAHKYQAACWVVAGSRGMTGAARLVSAAAQRAGCGYVRLSTPGPGAGPENPIEAVGYPLPIEYWDRDVLYSLGKMSSLIVGPGLGLSDETRAAVRSVVSGAAIPLVIDGDGLTALGGNGERFTAPREAATVMTPHDGEFAKLMGEPPTADRLDSARAMAARFDAVVVLKGPTTICATSDGEARFVTSGSKKLATAGTGDVLAGIIGAFLARGSAPLEAASAAVHVHGVAGKLAPSAMIASDLVDVLDGAMIEVGIGQ